MIIHMTVTTDNDHEEAWYQDSSHSEDEYNDMMLLDSHNEGKLD